MVAARLAAREADVADHDAEPTAGNEGPLTCAPDAIELIEEVLVARQVTELSLALWIFFETSVRRRGYNQVY